MAFFDKIKAGLSKTRDALSNTLGSVFSGFSEIDDDFYDELEESLILADLGMDGYELPDDPFHYITGRLHVAREYNDPAHAAVTVTAVCGPWKYSTEELVVNLTATATEQTARLVNSGRLAVVPTLVVSGSGASVRLVYGNVSRTLSAGTYQLPDLLLTPGAHALTYTGTGSVKITYREAVLE